MDVGFLGWALFIAFILGVLCLDLFVLNRAARKTTVREAIVFSGVWVTLALLFAWGVWQQGGEQGGALASQFLTGYVLELSLSVDNLFVFLLIFAAYKVPERLLHKALFWGILGAIVLRMAFIGVGAALVSRFAWVLYLFGAFLLFTGLRLFFHREEGEAGAREGWLVRQVRRLFHVTKDYDAKGSFFVRHKGAWAATPLLLVVAIIESTDLLFAVDSIPAVFGVTKDPFIVYTSNIFAILGLRSMFFALEGLMHMFRFLKPGLSLILILIGLKLCFLHLVEARLQLRHVELMVLGVVLLILLGSVGLSILLPAREARRPARPRAKLRGARA
jgi:tellurite resistance protein TerC